MTPPPSTGAPPAAPAQPQDDLDFDFAQATPWFPHEQDDPYVLVRVSDDHARSWSAALGLTVRRCYVSDSVISTRAREPGISALDVISAVTPDAGSTMSGDFGEILVYLYQGAKDGAVGPKKWRLKQDRAQPAPHSDVVQFVLHAWPTPTEQDVLFCSEVKSKSTRGSFNPIKDAIEGTKKDRGSRLGRTLAWLRERAIVAPLGDVQIAHLDRFINSPEHAPYVKCFRAVAVICESLVAEELQNAPDSAPSEYTVVVIAVPDLKGTYSAVFDAAKQALPAAPLVGGTT